MSGAPGHKPGADWQYCFRCLMAQKWGPPRDGGVLCEFFRAGRSPWLLTLSSFLLCFIRHYFPSTQSLGTSGLTGQRPELRLASPHHGNLTPARISAGCPHCLIPRSRGAVTGQKDHYRLTGSLRNSLPSAVFRTDGYRSAPYLAVFYKRNGKKERTNSVDFVFLPLFYRWSRRILRRRFPFWGLPANVFRSLDMNFSRSSGGK
jgi:hypothetical protein